MAEGGYKRSVSVAGELREITVYQKSKSVWIATGKHKGRHFEAKSSSLTAAENAWRAKAEYHYHQN
jgi:hypothetical protein